MGQRLSKKDKLARLRKRLFTGRADELTLFSSLLPLNRQTQADILVIYGIGGIGKSVLLGEYRRICNNSDIPVAFIDGQAHHSIFSLLLEMETQLSDTTQLQNSTPINFPEFNKGLKRYWGIQRKLVRRTDIPQKIAKILVQTAKTVPVAGTVAEVVGEDNIQLAIDLIYSTVGRIDGDFFLQPEEELTASLVGDLNEYAVDRRVVVMFDTYEVMTALDGWVRDSFFANLSEYALLVIAGRNKLEGKDWSEYFPLMIQQELGSLSIKEAQEYLYKRGVVSDRVASEMATFADGHPLTLALLAELEPNIILSDLNRIPDLRNIIKELIERIVGKIEADLRAALEICGILRFNTEESLAYMLERDRESISNLFAKLRKLDFAKVHNTGLSLHEAVRTALEEDLRWRAPERYRTLHAKAAEYYQKCLSTTRSEDKERFSLEHLYHRIRANEEEGTKLFQNIAEEFAGYRLINRLRALLNEVNEYPLEKDNSKLWREYYNARLALLEMRLNDAETTYQMIAKNEHIEPKLRAYSLCDWGEILSRYERLAQPHGIEKANSVLDQSIQLVPLDFHLARSFVSLARVHQFLFRSDQQTSLHAKAKEFFEQYEDRTGLAYVLIEMKKELGSRGLWRDLFDIQIELEDLQKHLPETPALECAALWIWTWGEVLAGRLFESEQKYIKSIALSRSLDDSFSLLSALRDLGWTLGFQGRYDEANQKFEESLEIAERLGQDYIQDFGTGRGFWGAVLTRQGKFSQATEYLLQALHIKEEIKDYRGILEQLVWLGKLYEIQKELDKAREYYNRSLELKFCRRLYFDADALTSLVRVAYACGDYSATPPLIADSEALAQKYEYNDHLASLNLTQGHIAWNLQLTTEEYGNEVGFETVLSFYKKALIYALRYNRILLDEVLWGGDVATSLHPVITYCLEKGKEGQRMLTALRDWWQRDFNNIGVDRPDTISLIPENISLLEAESIAREREIGDGSPQQTVVDRINEVLTTSFKN